MAENHVDVAVIGQGPAGMAAALYAARAGLSVAVFEGMGPGGQMASTEQLDNYPGFEQGIGAFDLAYAMSGQAARFGAITVEDVVTELDLQACPKVVTTGYSGQYAADAVILCMGATPRPLGIEREQALTGRGVSYCATCDGGFFRGKTAVVVGGGNTAVGDAIYLSNLCDQVHLVHRRDAFRADAIYTNGLAGTGNMTLHMNSTVTAIHDENGRVCAVDIQNLQTGETQTVATAALFVAVGTLPKNDLLIGSGLELDRAGYVVAGETGATNIPGVYVAGDLRTKPLRQVITAAADGANAATAAFEYLALGHENNQVGRVAGPASPDSAER